MATHPMVWPLMLALTGYGAAACDGTAKHAPAPPTGSAPAAATAQGTTRNACALVDRAALEAIAGVSLTLLHDIEDEDQTTCEISDPDRNMVVSVTVHWKGGRDLAQAEHAAMSMAKQALNEGDVDVLALTGSGNVGGLADQAFYSDLMPSWVLKGDVMVQVISPRFNHEQTRKVFLSTARTALPQL